MKPDSLTRVLGSLGCVSIFVGLIALAPAMADGTIEVVQSVPLETTLAVPGIRMAQEVWLEMIGAARQTLDLEQFYISNEAGQALEPVIQAIEQAAARGVRVRLLMDTKFYSTYPDTVNEISKLTNCEARLIDYSPEGGVQHAKYFVVDGKQAFVGSQNFDWRALNQIHEIGVRLTDAKVNADLESIFEIDWAKGKTLGTRSLLSLLADFESLLSDFAGGASSLPDAVIAASPQQDNPNGIPDSLSQVVGLMNAAQTSIRIQVMEYTTKTYTQGETAWRALDNAIRAAARRGVQIQLLVDISDVKKAKKDLTSLAQVKNVEIRSVTIPAWSGGAIDYARLIHSKYLVADGAISWVGSENWSEGYFMNTRDVGVVIRAQSPTTQLNQVFDRVWTSAYISKI